MDDYFQANDVPDVQEGGKIWVNVNPGKVRKQVTLNGKKKSVIEYVNIAMSPSEQTNAIKAEQIACATFQRGETCELCVELFMQK
ncbi:MAG: hypothetical protein M3Q63_00560 [bacterium]|nr:hypothetical protein [bacterium]